MKYYTRWQVVGHDLQEEEFLTRDAAQSLVELLELYARRLAVRFELAPAVTAKIP